jgi:zinc-ribbon domain
MEIGAIFLLLVLIVLIGLFVARPFARGWQIKAQSSPQLSTLLAERERALTALMELDFDEGIGKIPEQEYTSQRAALIKKGTEILRQLDEIQPVRPAQVTARVEPAGEPDRVQSSDEDLEDLIAKRRSTRKQKTAGFCPNCGKPILQSDKYCPSCGQELEAE